MASQIDVLMEKLREIQDQIEIELAKRFADRPGGIARGDPVSQSLSI